MPRAEAPATSMVLTPAPARTMSARGPASSTGACTGVERTTSTAAPVRRDRLGQRGVLGVGFVDHLAAERPQAVESARFELVGDQHLHRDDLVGDRRTITPGG